MFKRDLQPSSLVDAYVGRLLDHGVREISVEKIQLNHRAILGTGVTASVIMGNVDVENEKKPVAVKMIYYSSSVPAIFHSHVINYAVTEAKMLRRLASPHVIKLYGYIYVPNQYFGLVLDLCKYGDLQTQIERKSILDIDFIRYALFIAWAIDYIHRSGFVHRDLKPENILITEQNDNNTNPIRIADCANVCRLSELSFARPAGTAGFMPNEAIEAYFRGRGMLKDMFREILSEKIDVFSYAMIIFCLVSSQGEPYSKDYSSEEINCRIRQYKLPVIPDKTDDLMKDIIVGGWHRDPSGRPSMAEILSKFNSNLYSDSKQQQNELSSSSSSSGSYKCS